MQYQNEPGIYVYKKERVYKNADDFFGQEKVVVDYYPTYDDFFRLYNEVYIRLYFGYSVDDDICYEIVSQTRHRSRYGHYWYSNKKKCLKINCKEHNGEKRNAYAAYDENGKLLTPDHLVGLRRAWRTPYRRYGWSWAHAGRKKHAWGGYRSLRTTQERRWAHAWDDEEFAPKVRAARQGKNLPNSWDDFRSHNDKSWKTQSKRKHQWRPK